MVGKTGGGGKMVGVIKRRGYQKGGLGERKEMVRGILKHDWVSTQMQGGNKPTNMGKGKLGFRGKGVKYQENIHIMIKMYMIAKKCMLSIFIW